MSETAYDSSIAGLYCDYKGEKFNRSHFYLGTQFVWHEIGAIQGKSILDFGCGNGFEAKFLAQMGAQVVGIDHSQDQITYAQTHNAHPNVQYICSAEGDLRQLVATNQKFDAIITNFVLCTIEDDQKVAARLTEISKLLKENGKFIILNNNPEESGGKDFISWDCKDGITKEHGVPFEVNLHANPSFKVVDFYRSNDFYMDLLAEAGLNVTKLIKPLGSAAQQDLWLDETHTSPITIFVSNHARHKTKTAFKQPAVTI